jgi:hypothetical protein
MHDIANKTTELMHVAIKETNKDLYFDNTENERICSCHAEESKDYMDILFQSF